MSATYVFSKRYAAYNKKKMCNKRKSNTNCNSTEYSFYHIKKEATTGMDNLFVINIDSIG